MGVHVFLVLLFGIFPLAFAIYTLTTGARVNGSWNVSEGKNSEISCVFSCELTQNCVGVNFNPGDGTCETIVQSTDGQSLEPTPNPAWHLLLKPKPSVSGISVADAFAWQSTTDSDRNASRAIDGITGGVCTKTLGGEKPWWQIELDDDHTINGVIIWNKIDSSYVHLRNLRIYVSQSLPVLNQPYNLCNRFDGPPLSAKDNPIRLPCSPKKYGQFIKIHKAESSSIMQLCEVIIF